MEATFYSGSVVTVILLITLAIVFICLGVHQVPDGNARVVERMGKRHKVLMPGINITIPILDTLKKNMSLYTYLNNGTEKIPLFRGADISLAEQRMDPSKLRLLGKDNSEITVNSVAYFRIEDPIRAVYDVASFAETFQSIVLTTLRQEIGKLDSDSVITARESLGENLRSALQEAAVNWGIRVIRVEIENIDFDREVVEQLSQARRAELIRRSELVAAKAAAEQTVMTAEAEKRAILLRAEADKAKAIAEAEGKFEADRLAAEGLFLLASREEEGRAQGYAAINKAMASNSEAIIALEAVKAQISIAESLGKSNSSLIIPTETAGLFGSVAAAIKGLKSLDRGNI